MGKPKGKKGRQTDEFSDDGEDLDPLAQEVEQPAEVSKPAAAKKGKKHKKKKDDDWEDDVTAELDALSLENKSHALNEDDSEDEPVVQLKSKKKEKKKKKQYDSEEEEHEAAIDMPATKSKGKSKQPAKASFALLMGDDSDEDKSSTGEQSEEEIKPAPKKNQKKKPKKQSSEELEDEMMDDFEPKKEDPKPVEETQTQKKKGKKEKKKKNKADDDDIDAIMAEIEGKTAPDTGIDFKDISSMTPDQIAAAMDAEYSDDDDKKKKKKGKKGAKQQEQKEPEATQTEPKEGEEVEDNEEGDGEEGETTVKSAAQKKKEKRERQKQKKLEEAAKAKAKKSGKKEAGTEEAEAGKEDGQDESTSHEATPTLEDANKGEEEEEEEDGKKKKKKDKKKKGEKEEPKKKTSKMAKLILEQQQKIREEEERQKREEEEEERRLEEARIAKEEAERVEKEKREKKKAEKAAKIARQKADGTYMTAKQREEKRIALAKLQALGIKLPDGEEKKKKPVYDNRKKNKKKMEKQESVESKEESPTLIEPPKDVLKEEAAESKEKQDDAVADEWDAADDVKDEWDAESEDEAPTEEEAPKLEQKKGEKAQEKKKDENEEEEDEKEDEESEEESSEDESEEESSSDEDDGRTAAEKARDRALRRIEKRKEDAEKQITVDRLRAAVVCVLGHVDTGKTKILDKLRRTNVQDNEAGGITQQIGATNVPVSAIREQTKMCKDFSKKELKLPGLLIIDTPGHESFSNLRTRGSSLCDIAILVVDIMHGLEPQTIESINLLKARKCPFVVALNKIDRLYQWQSNPHTDVVNQLKKQKPNTKIEFEERVDHVRVQFAEQGLNVALFHENPNPKEYISLVPTSAHSGDGMGNLIALICELTQTHLAKRVAFSPLLQATVMEVKSIPGLGTTIDVILVNGSLQEGQTIIVPGSEGPIITQIRGLLLPQPMKELRVKGAYDHVKEITAAQGVKIIGKDLEKSLAGLPMHVAYEPDEIDVYREELEEALEDILKSIKLQEKGVFVQASTLGSLEALLQFLRDSKIPYAGINIGPVHRKDVMKASVMLERDVQYAVILAFDVKVEREAQEMADTMGIRIFTAEIIYHLFDAFTKYRQEYKRAKQNEFKNVAVFPCKMRVLPQFIFNSRDPIVMGVIVEAGFVKVGTPICVPSKEFCYLGIITSLEVNHKPVEKANKGTEVCIKIENVPGETPKLYGRHFDENDLLVSKISRNSIDAVKNYFRDEMTKAEWQLIIELKKRFEII